jgi:ANTAR domain/GAF domain
VGLDLVSCGLTTEGGGSRGSQPSAIAVVIDFSLSELSAVFDDIGSRLIGEDDVDELLALLVHLTVERVPGAEYAGITLGGQDRRFTTVAATDDIVLVTDRIQYELGAGPCVDAVLKQSRFNASDLRTDPRWPEFGRRAAESTGILSMFSQRLYMESDHGLIAGLNAYSHQPSAFDETSETIGLLMATHGALALSNAGAQQKARNLERALKTSREIGIAMGVLMAQNKISRDQAFDLLRIASQHAHRKLAEIAAQVAETGALPTIPRQKSQTNGDG